MCLDLNNKVVVITGGARGIGYNIADKYLQQGAKTIIILDISEKHGVDAEEKLNTKFGDNKVVFLKFDITTDVEAVSKKLFSSYKVDVLVNSAGVINEVQPRKAIDVNVTGVINMSFKLWQYMRNDKGGNGGTIIIISSVSGLRINHLTPTYNSTKHAIVAFAKSLGHDANYKRSDVRVIVICPGITDTGMPLDFIIWDEALIEELENVKQLTPWQDVDAVGNAAVEIYQNAKSGTVWVIEDAKPIVEA